MIYLEKPEDFDQKIEVVSCFVKHDNKILLLKRSPHKPQGETWGIPAGKKDKIENSEEAVRRELEEETGIKTKHSDLNYFKTIFVRYPSYDFKYDMFFADFTSKPEVKINPDAHTDYTWLEPTKALDLDLIQDEDRCIKLFFNI